MSTTIPPEAPLALLRLLQWVSPSLPIGGFTYSQGLEWAVEAGWIVIQTEAAIQYLLAGQNPYVQDYVNTPMAEWGFSAYRTALYHYPYLPWTFIFSAPFYVLGTAAGFYDQRLVYLLL